MPAFLVTRTLRLSLGALALAAAAQAAAELVIYEDNDQGGRSLSYVAMDANLARSGFNDRTSSVVIRSGTWQLCSDVDFQGQCITLNPGTYRSLSEWSMNDRVSSVRPVTSGSGNAWGGGWGGSNAPVELFEHIDYGGRAITSTGSSNLQPLGFNDRASSIVIRSGRWDFCADLDYRGRCITLGPGSYANLASLSLNDEISSVRASTGSASQGSVAPGGTLRPEDAEVAEILMGGSNAGRVTYPNGCVVYYNSNGQRYQNLPVCSGQQIAKADARMTGQRSEKGLNRADSEHPWLAPQPPGHAGYGSSPPEIFMGTNREGEVVFGNNCVAYYNAQGRRYAQQPTCNSGQLRQADQAMAAYRREQGL